jgi:hypothetical protein
MISAGPPSGPPATSAAKIITATIEYDNADNMQSIKYRDTTNPDPSKHGHEEEIDLKNLFKIGLPSGSTATPKGPKPSGNSVEEVLKILEIIPEVAKPTAKPPTAKTTSVEGVLKILEILPEIVK